MEPMGVWTDDVEWYVARSLDDVEAIIAEREGSLPPEQREDWSRLPGDAVIGIWCDAKGEPTEIGGEGAVIVHKTADEWIDARGRGFLCSTES